MALISVVMGVYNQSNFEQFDKAVNSVLNQTLSDLEFLIYNDGSNQRVTDYIRALAQRDERIRIIESEENKGLAHALNECIRYARGSYIARMDADDIAKPERFFIQYNYLTQHQECSYVGCCAELIDVEGVWGYRNMPEYPQKRDYLKYSPYIHPSVMFRAEVFQMVGGYQESRETMRCEDYELFLRLYTIGIHGYNIQRALLQYREDREGIKKRSYNSRVREAMVRKRYIRKLSLSGPWAVFYLVRPLAAGLVPWKLKRLLIRVCGGVGCNERTRNLV